MTYPLTLGYVFWKGFLEYTNSSCVISAGHCSEIQTKVVLLLLVASPWAGALASAARCACWAALAFPTSGAAGVRSCDYWVWRQLCCSHLSKSCFPSTLRNIAQTAFHGLERFQLQGEPVAAGAILVALVLYKVSSGELEKTGTLHIKLEMNVFWEQLVEDQAFGHCKGFSKVNLIDLFLSIFFLCIKLSKFGGKRRSLPLQIRCNFSL